MRQTLTNDFWGLHKNMNCAFPLKFLQNSHVNTCVWDSLINLPVGTAILIKKRPRCRCFPVNFGKVLRTLFFRTPLDDCFYTLIVWYFCIIKPTNKTVWKKYNNKDHTNTQNLSTEANAKTRLYALVDLFIFISFIDSI